MQGEGGARAGRSRALAAVSDLRRAPTRVFWALAACVLGLDWVTKRWAIARLSGSDPIDLLGDTVRLTFTRNTGVAFGLFADLRLPLGWVSLVALFFVLWLALRSGLRTPLKATALGLILGGAIGNLIDRVRWGSVVDFIDIGVGELRWPVFNVADSAITIGVLLWAGQLFLHRSSAERDDALEGTPAARHGGGA